MWRECGLGPGIPAAEVGSSLKVLWHEIQVWANSPRYCMLWLYRSQPYMLILHLKKASLEVDGDLVSSWAMLLSVPARRSSSAPAGPTQTAGEQESRALCWVWILRCRQRFGLCLRGKTQRQVECWERVLSKGMSWLFICRSFSFLFPPLTWILPAPCGTFSQFSLSYLISFFPICSLRDQR